MPKVKLQILAYPNREPRVVNGDYCSTARKSPGQCVYLERSDCYCRLFDDLLEKDVGKYLRCDACFEELQANNIKEVDA